MSESFPAAVGRVNYAKYIDQLEDELKNAMASLGPGKTPQEIEATQTRLQEVIRKQSKEIAKEVGFTGNSVLIFMTSMALVSTAWVSYILRKETADLAKSPEDRLAMIDMLESLNIALGGVIEAATKHADVAKK